MIVRIRGGIHSLYKNSGGRCSQKIHCRTDQRLVGFEINCSNTQQTRIQHSGQNGSYHRNKNHHNGRRSSK